jgi:hypothetical protein
METRADRKRGISGIFDEDAADRDRSDLRVYPSGTNFLIPISLAVTGSVSAFHLCVECKTQPTWRAHHEDIPIGTGDPVLNRVRVLRIL